MDTTQQKNLEAALQEYFGFKQFKGEQKKIVESVMDGKDTFVIMPTGGGKSLCYQLPAMIKSGTALIISPLIALMKNQVDLIRGYCSNDSVAHFMNSTLNRKQVKVVEDDLRAERTKLLYVAPETLTKESTIELMKELDISFVAVDEAHCISEWGHDFRKEYRNIKKMLEEIRPDIPIVALTATATPKVRQDIIRNLRMEKPDVFISSFNRDNLYYEVRPKVDRDSAISNIVKFIQENKGKSGIIYCLNRKSTEELAETLRVNGINALAYHAGFDSGTRSKVQDDFLMERVDVITATIAFGMGIDKPDVRFVIHFDIPKSLENYYQETGRAGRDGGEGVCLAYFSQLDINKLDKFLRDKPVKEREIGSQHLAEVVGYAESASCRRQYLLHYFGEEYGNQGCGGVCDNCRNPRETMEAQGDALLALKAVRELGEAFRRKYLVDYLMGKKTQDIIGFRHDKKENFGKGKGQPAVYWSSILQQAMLRGLLEKDIEDYGIIGITKRGSDFIDKPHSFEIALNHDYTKVVAPPSAASKAELDPVLLGMLNDLRKVVAGQKNLPPFVIFQDASLHDMATQYPINSDEMANIVGVSKGKALKYGKRFMELITKYVADNKIERPNEIVTKQVAKKSKAKVSIIQNVDKKVPLPSIADGLGMQLEDLLIEVETIVASGTKLNIDYFINDNLDQDQQDEIYEYFMEAESDDVDEALKELDDDDYTENDIRLMRVKFMSEVAN